MEITIELSLIFIGAILLLLALIGGNFSLGKFSSTGHFLLLCAIFYMWHLLSLPDNKPRARGAPPLSHRPPTRKRPPPESRPGQR